MKRHVHVGARVLVGAFATVMVLSVQAVQAKGPPPPAPTPQLAFDQTSWSFPTTNSGEASSPQDFTLTYVGKSPSGRISATVGSTAFTITADTCSRTSLKPNGTCTVTVEYAPTTPDTTANADLTATAKALSATVALSGDSPALNHAPTADNQTATVNESSGAVGFTVTGGDPDGDTLNAGVVTEPSHGTLNFNGTDPSCVGNQSVCTFGGNYTPSVGFFGTDSFTFITDDGSLQSAAATVTITVNAVSTQTFCELFGGTFATGTETVLWTCDLYYNDQQDNVLLQNCINNDGGTSAGFQWDLYPVAHYTCRLIPELSINDPAAIPYGPNAVFTVTMSKPSTTAVTFDWATADGTAVWVSGTTCGGFNGPNDYIGSSGSKTIAAGSTSTTISVQTCSTGPGNRQSSPTNFTLTISNPSAAVITDDTGIATLNPT